MSSELSPTSKGQPSSQEDESLIDLPPTPLLDSLIRDTKPSAPPPASINLPTGAGAGAGAAPPPNVRFSRMDTPLRVSNETPRKEDSDDEEEWDAWDAPPPSPPSMNATTPIFKRESDAGSSMFDGGGRSSLRRSLHDEEDEEELKDPEAERLALANEEGGEEQSKRLRKALYWRHTAITGVFVLLWYSFSTCISLYNKWIFGSNYFGFPFPMFSTFVQMIVQFCLAAVVRYTMPGWFKPDANPNVRDYVHRVTPTGVTTALDIGLSNLSLKTITLSLYTMCKSSTLVFVLIFAFIFRLETFSWKLIMVIFIITSGVFLMAYNTTAVSIPGAIMVFVASVLGGLRWALTHTLMLRPELGMTNPFATIFWITPLMAVTLAFVSMYEDGWGEVFSSDFFAAGRILWTLLAIILPGFLAFSMVASEYYIIQRAGVVPLSVAGVFKEVTTISIASWLFGDEITTINVVGLCITMIGIAFYSHHKYEKSISGSPTDAHGQLSTGHEGEETMPLTSLRERGEDERDGGGGGGGRGGGGGGGFWGFLSSSLASEQRPHPDAYHPVTIFADDEPGVLAADDAVEAHRQPRRERSSS